MIISFHDLYYVDEGWSKVEISDFLGSLLKALKPGGRFLIVDHAAEENTGASAAQSLHRIDEAFAKKKIEASEFKLLTSDDTLKNASDEHSKMVLILPSGGKTNRFILVFENLK